MANKPVDAVGVTEASVRPDSREGSLGENRRRILGIALPSYFNTDKERTLVRKFDLFLL